MKYFLYNQNNSGGLFAIDGNVAEYVIIEAVDEICANEIAFTKGIYFDGVDKQMDCECCGDRWYYPSEYNTLEEARGITTNCQWAIGKGKSCREYLQSKEQKIELDEDLFHVE